MSTAVLKKSLNDEIFQLGLLITVVALVFLCRFALTRAPAPVPAPSESVPAQSELEPSPLGTPPPDTHFQKNPIEDRAVETLPASVPAPPVTIDRPFQPVGDSLERALSSRVKGKWVVDIKGGAESDVRSIGQAVMNAAPGDLIEIRPGYYREHLMLARSVTLRGLPAADGKIGVTIEGATDNTVLSTGSGITIESLNLVQTFNRTDPQFTYVAIAMMSGELTLKNVVVKANNTAALWMGAGKFKGEQCAFTGSRGIEQLDGTLTCDDCVSSGNSDGGILLGETPEAGKPVKAPEATFRRLKAGNNGDVGIWAIGSAKATLEAPVLSENKSCGLRAGDKSTVTVTGGDLSRNLGAGACVDGSARVEMKNAKLNRNGQYGAFAGADGKLIVSDSEFRDNEQFGYIYDSEKNVVATAVRMSGNRLAEKGKVGEPLPVGGNK